MLAILIHIRLGGCGHATTAATGGCAGLAVLLYSEAGRYITGQDLFVDGGMSLP
jgi:hypothetical protein